MKKIDKQRMLAQKDTKSNDRIFRIIFKRKLASILSIKNVSYSNSYEYDSKPGEKGKIVNRVKTHGAESEPEQPGEGNRYGSKINPKDDENASNKKGVIGVFK